MTSVFEKSQQGLFSNPNVLINSCLRENQRGQDSYAADGFTFDRLWIETGSGACSITRTANNYTTDPFKAPYYATLDVTTAGDYIGICLTSEDSRRFRGNPTMTLSFWYRLVGRDITIDEHHGNGGKNWEADTTPIATLPQTGTWTKFETTFNVADWANDYDPNDIFLIGIRQRDTGDTPFTLRIADMKLEFGAVATPWVMEDTTYNLDRCQRFYKMLNGVYLGYSYNNSSASGSTTYVISGSGIGGSRMRTTSPSVTCPSIQIYVGGTPTAVSSGYNVDANGTYGQAVHIVYSRGSQMTGIIQLTTVFLNSELL